MPFFGHFLLFYLQMTLLNCWILINLSPHDNEHEALVLRLFLANNMEFLEIVQISKRCGRKNVTKEGSIVAMI